MSFQMVVNLFLPTCLNLELSDSQFKKYFIWGCISAAYYVASEM